MKEDSISKSLVIGRIGIFVYAFFSFASLNSQEFCDIIAIFLAVFGAHEALAAAIVAKSAKFLTGVTMVLALWSKFKPRS